MRSFLRAAVLSVLVGFSSLLASPAAGADEPPPPALSAALEGGVLHSSDTFAGSAYGALVGLAASYRLGSIVLLADGHDLLGSASYFSQNPSLAGSGPARLDVNEQRLDGDLGAGYRLALGARDLFVPSLGVRYIGFENSAYPSSLFGVRVGAFDSLQLSSMLGIGAWVGWTYGLAKSIQGPSALGAPIDDLEAGLAAELTLGEATTLALGGELEAISFQYTTRVFDGVVITLSRGF